MELKKLIWMVVWPLLFYDAVTVALGLVWPDGGVLLLQAVSAAVSAGVLGVAFQKYSNKNQIWGNGFKGGSVRLYIVSCLLGIASCLFLNGAMELSGLKQLFPEYQQTAQELYAPPLALQILAMGVLIPLAEELIFRGFLYGSLRKSGSFAASVLISSVIFGVYHGSVVQGLYAGFFAVILAVSYEYSGSLIVVVLVHGISNLTSVLCERYHLFGKNWTAAASGVLMVWLLCKLKDVNPKEDI